MCLYILCDKYYLNIRLHIAVVIAGKVPEIMLAKSMVVGERVNLYMYF